MRSMGHLPAAACLAALVACAEATPHTMDAVAEQYVRLVLAVGPHDPDFVDAYYGDPGWRPSGNPAPLAALAARAHELRDMLAAVPGDDGVDEMVELRREYLDRQLAAVAARIEMLSGETVDFDEESRRLYDAEAPRHTEADFQTVLDELDDLLPGEGTLPGRYAAFREAFVIPRDRLDAVFRAAIDGCRERTAAHVALPAGEQFTVEYVTNQSWSAYNWYKGDYTSLIQMNTDLPITIDRAVDLACHEGYPGHHVYNVLLEQHLVRKRGWVEFSVYPLFSPQSLIAEGTANYGIAVAFPGDERTAFERDTLYPLAGLDPATAATYAAVMEHIDRLSYAGNEAARQYLNGTMSREQAAAWLETWAMMPADVAEQRTRFFDQYRSYVINYNLGRDLVRAYVERNGGTADQPDVRWDVFARLLASPRLPSGLR